MKAFPKTSSYDENNGMDLRDYFAAKAMQALIEDEQSCPDWLSKTAYEYADAMMKAREK